jgi:hypothetical protein
VGPGLRRWTEKRGGKTAPEKRPGVAISRRDLTGVPAPTARLLWRDLHVRDTYRSAEGQRTDNVRIDIRVDGVSDGAPWSCGLEFDYSNEETFLCRPLRLNGAEGPARMPVPAQARTVRVAFLAPMSGLAANEPRLELGAINVRIGEGRTAEVLRNLCHQVLQRPDGNERWERLSERITTLFGVELDRTVTDRRARRDRYVLSHSRRRRPRPVVGGPRDATDLLAAVLSESEPGRHRASRRA